MKRKARMTAGLAIASLTFALSVAQPGLAQAAGNDAKKDAAAAPAAPAAPAGKHLPEAKTQPEFDAYQAAVANTTGEALEKAADDFAQKFPASEIKVLVYKQAMQAYQNANNLDKIIDMGRKCLALDPDDPQVLANTAQALSDSARPTDIDKDQKNAEAEKYAQHALQTVDTNLVVNPGTPQEKVDEYKGYLRSTAYGSLGVIYYGKDTKEDYAKAEDYLRKSVDAFPSQPDPTAMLRLAIAMDKQGKYIDALAETDKVVAMTKEGTQTGDTARREQSRLQTKTKDLIK
jgi:tetratricopeptide (TPR) repeat protein